MTEKSLLRTMTHRKLWSAMIAYILRGHVRKRKRSVCACVYFKDTSIYALTYGERHLIQYCLLKFVYANITLSIYHMR